MTLDRRLPFPLTLSGPGVVLREWRSDDLDDLVDLLDDPDIARWTPMTTPFDLEAGLAYLRRAHQGRVTGRRIQLAVTADGGRPLGEVLLFGADNGLREAELGYLIGAPWRGQGLATRALTVLSGYARRELGLSRLLLRIDPDNTASTAVARRCGYRKTSEPPILQAGPHGASTLDTWEWIEGGPWYERRKNVATRRYGPRGN